MNLMYSDLCSGEMGGLAEVVFALLGGSRLGAVEHDPFTLVAKRTRSLVSYYFALLLFSLLLKVQYSKLETWSYFHRYQVEQNRLPCMS